MAKLNKELRENLKEINSIIFKMTEVDNDVVLTTSIHSEMIVVSINFIKNGIVSFCFSFILSNSIILFSILLVKHFAKLFKIIFKFVLSLFLTL